MQCHWTISLSPSFQLFSSLSTFDFDWQAFLGPGKLLVFLQTLNFHFIKTISIYTSFISSYNFLHEVRIRCKMVLYSHANWHNFSSCSSAKSQLINFTLSRLICKLSAKMLYTYQFKIFFSIKFMNSPSLVWTILLCYNWRADDREINMTRCSKIIAKYSYSIKCGPGRVLMDIAHFLFSLCLDTIGTQGSILIYYLYL